MIIPKRATEEAFELVDKRIGLALDVLGPNKFGIDPLFCATKIYAQKPDLIPTLPGYATPSFEAFTPLAKLVGADPSAHFEAVEGLAQHRAAISDALVGGHTLTATAAAQMVAIAASVVPAASAAAALATPAGPAAQLAAVASAVMMKLNEAAVAIMGLQDGLDEIAARLSTATERSMGVQLPGTSPGAGEAVEELKRLAGNLGPAAPAEKVAAPPRTEPAAAPQPSPSVPPEVKPVDVPAEPTPAEPAEPVAPVAATAPTSPGAGSAVGVAAVEAAKTQLGTPYVWGGSQPGGFDCSGLTSWAYQQAGHEIPRVAADQAVGKQVSYDELQPGDLVIWSGHAAMYAGDGMMIEAGDPVQMNPVRTENIGMPFMGFWRPTG